MTWPAAVVPEAGVVEQVTDTTIRYRRDVSPPGGRLSIIRLDRAGGTLRSLVSEGEHVEANQVVAAVVPVSYNFPCPTGATTGDFIRLAASASQTDRYTAVKALGHFPQPEATAALEERVRDTSEHIYVRLDAASGLMRRGNPAGHRFFEATLPDEYLANRLEAVIVLAEVATVEASEMLIRVLRDPQQHPEIRAGAAWSLGELRVPTALSALVKSFTALDLVIQVEAARALAKLAREHLGDVLRAFPRASREELSGVAWALSKAGGFTVPQVLGVLPEQVGEEARHWLAYVVGTQERETMLPGIDALATRDPEVYFAVTVLWRIMASWIYGLEEY